MTPLSHHEILRHVGPFSRAALHVDLSATDRAARVIAFKPKVHAPQPDSLASGEITEQLRLNVSTSTPRLRRTVTTADGLEASLSARDNDLEALLQRVLAVPVHTHFRVVSGRVFADSFRCPDDSREPLVLRESRTRVPHFEIIMDARTVVDEPMAVALKPLNPRVTHQLPDDLVAVLGRPWSVLHDRENRWEFMLRVPAREPRRSTIALSRFEQSVLHLAEVLGDAPAAFHMAHTAARWNVWLRRLTPLLVILAMLGSLPLISQLGMDAKSGIHPLALGLPNVLILGFMYFSRHEIPSIGVPPLPRPLAADAWSPTT